MDRGIIWDDGFKTPITKDEINRTKNLISIGSRIFGGTVTGAYKYIFTLQKKGFTGRNITLSYRWIDAAMEMRREGKL